MKPLKSNNTVLVSTIIKIIIPFILHFSFPLSVTAQPSFHDTSESIEKNGFTEPFKITPALRSKTILNEQRTREEQCLKAGQ